MRFFLGVALLSKGESESALAAMSEETAGIYRLLGLAMAYHATGQTAESDAVLAELIKTYEHDAAYNIAYVLAFRGETDRAFEWLNKAVKYGDPGLADIPVESLFSRLYSDPRWLLFLERIGKSPEQLAAIKFEVTLPQLACLNSHYNSDCP